MPIPLFIGLGLAVAATGVGFCIKGAIKMKRANNKHKDAQERDKRKDEDRKSSKC